MTLAHKSESTTQYVKTRAIMYVQPEGGFQGY